jgi:hypothetical protein
MRNEKSFILCLFVSLPERHRQRFDPVRVRIKSKRNIIEVQRPTNDTNDEQRITCGRWSRPACAANSVASRSADVAANYRRYRQRKDRRTSVVDVRFQMSSFGAVPVRAHRRPRPSCSAPRRASPSLRATGDRAIEDRSEQTRIRCPNDDNWRASAMIDTGELLHTACSTFARLFVAFRFVIRQRPEFGNNSTIRSYLIEGLLLAHVGNLWRRALALGDLVIRS